MDHSLEGYLKRLSRQELNALLEFCSNQHNYDQYGYLIPEISDAIYKKENSTLICDKEA